ncbi:MAG: endonuclease/exonuclease/phosphatase family protein, partial [bacterium]
NQIRFLAKELKMNYAFGPNIKTGTGSYGNAILSKYPLKNIINHQLPTGENIEPRGVLEVKVTLPFKQDIHIFSTHFTPDNLNRGKQLFWVDYYLKSIEKPYIFMGDLNMENPVLNNKLSLTEELKTYPSANPTHGVDHIFSNASFEILERYVLDSKASDHLPVVVRFKAINLNKKV